MRRAYIAAHRAGWSNAETRAQWAATLAQLCLPVIGALPVAAIDTPLVLKVLEPIWTNKTVTAKRLRGRIENVLDWAKARGYRERRQPRALARASRQAAGEAKPAQAGQASSGAAVSPTCPNSWRASRAGQHRRAGA